MTESSSSWVVIPKNEYELLNLSKENELTQLEAEKLLASTDILIKFLKKSKYNYQIELSRWTFKQQEFKLYERMETCDELIKAVKSIETGFAEYNKKLWEAKEKSEEAKDI